MCMLSSESISMLGLVPTVPVESREMLTQVPLASVAYMRLLEEVPDGIPE